MSKKKISIIKKSSFMEAEPWIRDLQSKTINDNTFTCSVAILVESKPFYRQLSEEFDKFCQYGYRKCIKCISVDKIIETVFTNCTKNGEFSPLAYLCDEILKHTGKFFNGKMPKHYYKYIIKYILLDFKEKRLKEKWIASQGEIENQNRLKSYTAVSGKSSMKGAKPESIKKGADVKPAVKANSTYQVDKLNTQLHTRSENKRCLENIEDEPKEGPDLYVLIIQSQHSDLPLELISVDIPFKSIIQIGHLDSTSFDDENHFQNILNENKNENNEIKNILKQSYLDNFTENRSLLLEEEIRPYWSRIINYLHRKPYSHQLINMDILKYIPTIPKEPKSASFIDNLRQSLYDGISNIMFESVNLRQMYGEYVTKSVPINVSSNEVIEIYDLEYYIKVMDKLPFRASSVAMVLDTLVAQVCIDSKSSVGYNEDEFEFLREEKNNKNEPFKKLSCTEKLIKSLETINHTNTSLSLDSNKSTADIATAKILSYGDKLNESLLPLDNEITDFVKSRTEFIYKTFYDYLLWSKFDIQSTIDLHNKNATETDKDSDKEINEILICLMKLKVDHDEVIPEKWPYFDCFSGDVCEYCNDLINKLRDDSFVEFCSEKMSIIEPIINGVIFQMFEELLRLMSYYKYQYEVINDKIIICFYDKRVPMKQSAIIPTVLSLRDFVEIISNEKTFETNTILNNKKRYNYSDMLNEKFKKLLLTDSSSHSLESICVSTKYHSQPEEWLITNFDDVYEDEKKYKYSLIKETNNTDEERENLISMDLYNLNTNSNYSFDFFDMNIKLNESLNFFLHYWDIRNEEKYELSILAKIRNHEIHYKSNIIPDGFSLEDSDARKCNLYIEHSSGMIFSFVKTKGIHTEIEQIHFPLLNILSYNYNSSPNSSNIIKNDTFYNFELYISWPNGLLIEQIMNNNLPLYVKQSYLNITSDINIQGESYRCIVNNGTVLKFMEDNTFIILYSNGRIIKCTNYDTTDYKVEIQYNDNVNNIKMIEYEVRESDGQVYSVLNNIKTIQNPLIAQDFHDILDCSITTEFSDGIIYYHKSDGSLTITFSDGTQTNSYASYSEDEYLDQTNNSAQYRENDENIITDNNQNFEDANLEDENLEEENLEDGIEQFVVVKLSHKIDHPCYASVVFSNCGSTSIIAMPEKTQIKLSNDIHINFNEEVQIFNYKTSIVVREIKNGINENEIIFSYENFRDRQSDELPSPCISAIDSSNNSLLIYDNGKFEIDYSKVNDTLTQDKRLFIIDRDYSGFEVLSRYRLNREVAPSLMKNKNSIIRQARKEKNKDHLFMVPIPNLDKWSNFYDYLTIEKPVKMPSTYGKEWSFPIKEKNSDIELPSIILIKCMQDITCIPDLLEKNKEFFVNLNWDYREFDSEYSPPLFDHLLNQLKNLLFNENLAVHEYKKGNLRLDDECELRDTKAFILKIIMNQTDQSIYQINIDKNKVRYEEEKENILNKKILPYFENAEGSAFLLTQDLYNMFNTADDEILENEELDKLLLKPLENIVSEDLERIKELVIKLNKINLYVDGEDDINTFDQILTAGKKLEKYFHNINDVLLFHKNGQKDDFNYEKCPHL